MITITHNQILDEFIGTKGTKNRIAFEKQLRKDLLKESNKDFASKISVYDKIMDEFIGNKKTEKRIEFEDILDEIKIKIPYANKNAYDKFMNKFIGKIGSAKRTAFESKITKEIEKEQPLISTNKHLDENYGELGNPKRNAVEELLENIKKDFINSGLSSYEYITKGLLGKKFKEKIQEIEKLN